MESDSPHLRGALIVFEGIDGTGKSTHIQLLARYLRGQGIDVVTDFEPTRGPWGMKVREAAMSGQRLSLEEEIDCLLQDRREHVRNFIEPALAAGKWVLLDRYYLSMMAYQGASGANVEEIRECNEAFATVPDVAFWMDIPVEMSIDRMKQRGNAADAFENEPFLMEGFPEIRGRLNGDVKAGETEGGQAGRHPQYHTSRPSHTSVPKLDL